MQINVIVTPVLDVGHGGIGVERVDDTEAHERASVLRGYIQDATPGAGCGCIDGRCLLHTMSGAESKIGPKLAGGNSITTLFALELEDYFGDDASALMHYERTVTTLERENNPVKLHTDSHTYGNIEAALELFKDELNDVQTVEDFTRKVDEANFSELLGGKDKTKTACGMADGFAGAFYNMSRLPQDMKDEATGTIRKETPDEVQERLDFIKNTTFAFNEGADTEESEATFQRHVDRATELQEKGFFDGFSSIKLALILEKVLRDQGGEPGSVLDRIDVVEDDGQGVHGHVEWAAAAVSKKLRGKVLNTTQYARDTGLQVFGMELWAAEDNADAFATGPNVEAQKRSLIQGQISAQAAGYVGLADGSQRGVLFSL